LEIVELASGEVVLRRPDGQEPLVRIHFSADSRDYLGRPAGNCQAMIEAGIQAAAHCRRRGRARIHRRARGWLRMLH
jgi:hypothetical protein